MMILRSIMAYFAFSLPAQAEIIPDVFENELRCSLVHLCGPNVGCRDVSVRRGLVVAPGVTGHVTINLDSLGGEAVPAVVAQSYSAAVATLRGRSVFSGHAVYVTDRTKDGDIHINTHIINTRLYAPDGLSGMFMRWDCRESAVIG
jgi:hypothetical protein